MMALDFPVFARHLIALKCNSIGGVYEQQTIHRTVMLNKKLESELRKMIFSKLSDDDSLDQDKLAYLLNTDIILNSQGLAIWWRSLQDG